MPRPQTTSSGLSGIARAALTRAALILLALAIYPLVLGSTSARADGPEVGPPWVVSVGDSYISGEAGRWAGNTNDGYERVDALGAKAYDDNDGRTAELIPGCHRSESAEVHIGGGVGGKNLACSGARVASFIDKGDFKPGLDFYHAGGHEGQALMLEEFARTHNVRLIPLSIGGNNFDFAGIVKKCVIDFVLPVLKAHCYDKSPATGIFRPDNVARVREAIALGISNIEEAMRKAGYQYSQFKILVQDYPAVIPIGANFRYPESLGRQTIGGCGLWNIDADQANAKMLPTINRTVFEAVTRVGKPNIETMEIANAFRGHRLCARGVGLLEEMRLPSWREPGAAERSEWVSQVRTVTTLVGPYRLQEDLHPNYWGQLALRNCLRQAYTRGGDPRGVTCSNDAGLDAEGEPNMTLR